MFIVYKQIRISRVHTLLHQQCFEYKYESQMSLAGIIIEKKALYNPRPPDTVDT